MDERVRILGQTTREKDRKILCHSAFGPGSVRPHAVTETTAGWAFGYDANGNMTSRTVSEGTFDLAYTWENRLAAITETTSMAVTRYTYDADGVLVQKTSGDQITHYVNAGYEELRVGGAITPTKYYTLGSQRVSVRVDGALSYLYSDHLGSASLATDADGNVTAEMRYFPYGETRWSTGTMATDRLFTGQREEAGLGLYDYVARRYDPRLGRFLQADTIVPDPQAPQSLIRFMYCVGNPLKYSDPSGHIANTPDEVARADEILRLLLSEYDVTIDKDWGLLGIGNIWNVGNWEIAELEAVLAGASGLARLMGGTQQFRENLGGVHVMRKAMQDPGEALAHQVWLRAMGSGGFLGQFKGTWTVVHELSHAWDAVNDWEFSKALERQTGGFTSSGTYFPGGIPPKGEDSNFTRKEDFAESVATFIYPSVAQAFIQMYFSDKPKYQYDNYYTLPRAWFVAQRVDMDPQKLLFLQGNRW